MENASPLPPHPLLNKAQKRLEERLADLKETRPHFLSCFGLQNAEDLAAELAKIRNSLPEGGLFLGVIAGGDTLCELRECLMKAEIDLTNGASPRVAPMVDLESLSRLLPQAGFAHSAGDIERFSLIYSDIFALMRDVRRSGFAPPKTTQPRHFPPRQLFNLANEIYKKSFFAAQGGIVATVELLYVQGWKSDDRRRTTDDR